MRIYSVIHICGCGGHSDLRGVFSTKEKAMAFLNTENADRGGSFDLVISSLDKPIEEIEILEGTLVENPKTRIASFIQG